MRLIDADKLMEDIKGIHYACVGIRNGKTVLAEFSKRYRDDILQAIESQPTAYDIDKVVEQLEKERGIAFVTLANTGNKELDFAYQNVVAYMDKAIEIVKGGAE